MALPKQVQAQQKAAEEFDNQARAAAAATGQPGDDPPVDPPEPEPPAQVTEPQPQAPVPKEPPAEDSNLWKARFRSLQGMYNKQVPELQGQVRELTASVRTLTEQLAAAKEPPKHEVDDEPLVSKKDVDAFGEDLVDLARRIAREEFGTREKGYKQEINELREQLKAADGKVESVTATTAKTAREQFFERLNFRLPQWEAVQSSEAGQAFLASKIPGARATWNDALVGAASELDVDSVLEVFEALFEKHPELNPAAKPEPVPTPAKRELARQVTPAKTAAAAAAPPQKRTYTTREYEAESMRIIRLSQQGKHHEAQALEKELNTALLEGRIRV